MGAVMQPITFPDIDGNVVTEEWWFQLDETDAIEMDILHDALKSDGDPESFLQGIMDRKDSKMLLRLWKEILLNSVGRREGKKIVKDKATVDEFQYGGAYRKFFGEIITSEDAGVKFFMNLMPQDVQQKAAEKAARTYSNDELLAMNDEEFYKAAGTSDLRNMDQRFMTLAMNRLSNQKNAA
jgi:hypothetical protein